MHNTSCARRARYTFYEDELRTYLGEFEARLAEQEGRLELALRRVLDGSGRVDPPQEGLDGLHLRAAHQVELVEDEDVGKLELVAEQLGNGARVFGARLPATVDEPVHRPQLLEE